MANGPRKTTLGITFLLGIAVFCGFALLAWLLFRFAAPTATYEEKRAQNRIAKREAINKEAAAKLNGYAYVDKAKGIVQLPIDRAMELAMADLQHKSVQASQVKVESPYPAGLQTPPAAAPAASPAPQAPAANAPEAKK